MIRLIVADDHQIFVDGVKALISTMDTMQIVAEANNGVELIDCMSKHEVDVVLMDINMPKMDGIEATNTILEKYPDVKILVLSMHDSRQHIEKVLKAGAHGYLLKNTGKEELQIAIEKVMEGESYYSEGVTKRIMESLQSKKRIRSKINSVVITEREQEVLKLLVQELTTNEIAEKLFISHHTVESHRKNLIAKLQVRGTSGLVKYAIQSGLVD